jgi:hypothetical protein
VLGEPIDVRAQLQSGAKSRAAVGELTTRLEDAIRELMREANAEGEAAAASA